MERIKATGSSNIKSYGYDKVKRTLEVEFSNGGVYVYEEMPESKYMMFKNAKSMGGFLHKFIKNSHKVSKV